MTTFGLLRARVRLAWAILLGRVPTFPTLSELLGSLSIQHFVDQEREIRALKEEIAQLRRALPPGSPYRN